MVRRDVRMNCSPPCGRCWPRQREIHCPFTPAGKRGFFYEAWTNGEGWDRVSVKGADCPRITKEFLEEERQALGPMRFAQEYECEFIDAETSVFNSDLIQRALTDGFEPLYRRTS